MHINLKSKIDAYKFKDDLKFELENYVGDLEENNLGLVEQYKLGVTIPLSDYLNSFPRNCNEIYIECRKTHRSLACGM